MSNEHTHHDEAFLDSVRHSGLRPDTAQALLPVAALILLRWFETQDREAEAIAAFEGHHYDSFFPQALRWDRLRNGIQKEPESTSPIGSFPDPFSDILASYGDELAEQLNQPTTLKKFDTNRTLMIHELWVRFISIARKQLDHLAPRERWVELRAIEWLDAYPGFDTDSNRKELAAAFERLLDRVTKSDRRNEDFQTPAPVADLMLDLAAPRPGERVYDPCFGIGGLLTRAAFRLNSAASYSTGGQYQYTPVFGGEISAPAYIIGMVRIVLAGALPRLVLGDSLQREVDPFQHDLFDTGTSKGFDCIVAVPPFGQRITRTTRMKYAHFPIPSSDGTDLFMQHIMGALRPGGRAVVAVPAGFLFRSHSSQRVRQELIDNYHLESVFPLPTGAFKPYTGIRTAILAFSRNEPQQSIWFFPEDDIAQALGQTRVLQSRVVSMSSVAEDQVQLSMEPVDRDEARAQLASIFHSIRNFDDDVDASQQVGAEAFATPVSKKQIASRDYDLQSKRPGQDELDRFLTQARDHIPGLQIYPFHRIATLHRGVDYRREELTPNPQAGPPFIRIGDIKEGVLKKTGLYYRIEPDDKKARYIVRAGDLVLSVSGTIGKVTVVPKELDGAYASQGLLLIRLEGTSVQPGYLARLLQSAIYQDWFLGHARGGTIGHLSVKQLRNLRIPVPSEEQQDRVEAAVVAGADASEVMKALAEARNPDPLRSWLLSSSSKPDVTGAAATNTQLGGGAATLAAALPFGLAAAVAGYSTWKALNWLQARSEDAKLSEWMRTFSDIGQRLEDALDIEPGPDRFAMLESLRLPSQRLIAAIPDEEPAIQERMNALGSGLFSKIEKERQTILSMITVTARLEPAVFDLTTLQTTTLTLTNESPLRLRDLKIAVKALHREKEASQFPVDGRVSLELQVPASAAGEHTLMVVWQATRFDGEGVKEEIELAYRVRSVRDAVEGDFKDFGKNPYIAGKRLKPDNEKHRELFKGRQETLERLVDALDGQGGAATVIIEGARRIGKSSVAGQVAAAPQLLDDWLAVYCDLQGEQGYLGSGDEEGAEPVEGLATESVFYGIARALAFAAADAGYSFEIPGYGHTPGRPLTISEKAPLQEKLRAQFYESSSPAHLLDLFVAEVVQAVAPDTILLILDEFDKIQQGIQNGVTNPQVPENLRALFQRYDIAVIIVGSPRLRRLREQYFNALYGFAEPILLGPLDEDATRQLITEPVAGRLVYAPAAVNYIIELTACQPHIVQSLSREIFSNCKRAQTRNVTTTIVEECANKVAPTLPHFKHVFESDAESDRKRYLIAITEAEGEKGSLSFATYEQQLEKDGIGTTGLEDDLDDLVHEEILAREERRGETIYRLRIPLLAFWLRNADNYDYAILRSRAATEHPA